MVQHDAAYEILRVSDRPYLLYVYCGSFNDSVNKSRLHSVECLDDSVVLTKVKVKCTLVQALNLCTGRTAHRKSRGIPLLFLDHGTRRG